MISKFSFIILLEKINIKIKIISYNYNESIFRTFLFFIKMTQMPHL